MSTTIPDAEIEPSLEDLDARMDELAGELEAMQVEADQEPRMVVVGVHGTMDAAYPTLILTSLAAQMGWDVTVFASFWALDMLHEEKSKRLRISPVGNPNLGLPNAIGMLPGMTRVATWMMKRKIDEQGVDTVEELIDRAMEAGVEFQACQMTADLMGYEEDDFIEGVTTGVGAGSALMTMSDAEIQLTF